MNAAFSSLLTLFSSELVLHTLDRAIAYCVSAYLSKLDQTVLLPSMLVRYLESAIHLYLYLLTVIGASDEVLCPFYSALSISANWKSI